MRNIYFFQYNKLMFNYNYKIHIVIQKRWAVSDTAQNKWHLHICIVYSMDFSCRLLKVIYNQF